MADEDSAARLNGEIKDLHIPVETGEEGVLKLAVCPEADIILIALVGFSGFVPTMEALKAGKRVALANKESMVVGGELISREVPGYRDLIIPVDSEHSAIFQCLQGYSRSQVKRVILTASGGPFRGRLPEELHSVTAKQALEHPNWNMGPKITVDSATLMNKGFEVLEAKWLFDLELEKIEVVVHPQSLVHSMVEFVDGSILAQIGAPDMRVPIQYALTYPRREANPFPRADLLRDKLEFELPDRETFPCLDLAYRAGSIGGTMPACLNAANEIAVDLFLNGKISFMEIAGLIEATMQAHAVVAGPGFKDIINADRRSREKALSIV